MVGEVLTRCVTLRKDEVLQLRNSGFLMSPLHRAPYGIKTSKGALYDPLINHLYPFGVSWRTSHIFLRRADPSNMGKILLTF